MTNTQAAVWARAPPAFPVEDDCGAGLKMLYSNLEKSPRVPAGAAVNAWVRCVLSFLP